MSNEDREYAALSVIAALMLFAAVVFGCAPAVQYDDPVLQQLVEEVRDRQRPTLLVNNRSIETLVVRDFAGRKLATVLPGEKRCIDMGMYRNDNAPVFVRYLASPENYATESVTWGNFPGWYLEIGNTLYLDVNTMMPAKRCGRGR